MPVAQKVQIVVEHFRELVTPLLNGHGEAMVVVGSRKEAVRWQLAIDRYIKNGGYPIRTLVAFSGEVNDVESGPDAFSEHGASLNPNLRGRDIREAFNRTSTRSCWWPTNSRPGSISPCCAVCVSIGGSRVFRPCRPCPG